GPVGRGARGAAGARLRSRPHPARGSHRRRCGGRAGGDRRAHRERARGAARRARRAAGRKRDADRSGAPMAIALTDLAGAGVPGAEAVLGAWARLAARVDGVDDARVRAGLAAAADPVAALHALARLLDLRPTAPASLPLEALLCVLGGSAALAASLVAEGGDWVAAFQEALDGAPRSVAAHREALAGAGIVG